MTSSESNNWKIAARFMSMGEAEIAASALEAAGIDCQLADKNVIGVDWGIALAVGGVKLLVRDEDLERAGEIMFTPAADQVVEPVAETIQVEPPIVCPECGSPEYQTVPRFRIFLLIAAVFIGIGMAVDQPLFALTALVAVAVGVLLMPSARCSRCPHRWNPPARERKVEAPLPQPADMIEERCPRCGSFDVYRINDRPLKAIPLLIPASIVAVLPFWLMLSKRQCDSCGLKLP